MSPAQYVSVSLATCVGLCRFGEAWAALRAENLLTYLVEGRETPRRPRREKRRSESNKCLVCASVTVCRDKIVSVLISTHSEHAPMCNLAKPCGMRAPSPEAEDCRQCTALVCDSHRPRRAAKSIHAPTHVSGARRGHTEQPAPGPMRIISHPCCAARTF
jgi:hypothetical protein